MTALITVTVLITGVQFMTVQITVITDRFMTVLITALITAQQYADYVDNAKTLPRA